MIHRPKEFRDELTSPTARVSGFGPVLLGDPSDDRVDLFSVEKGHHLLNFAHNDDLVDPTRWAFGNPGGRRGRLCYGQARCLRVGCRLLILCSLLAQCCAPLQVV